MIWYDLCLLIIVRRIKLRLFVTAMKLRIRFYLSLSFKLGFYLNKNFKLSFLCFGFNVLILNAVYFLLYPEKLK